MSESLITKKAIAAGLKELMKRKSFDKITISDITNECGLNRQTFYYHFTIFKINTNLSTGYTTMRQFR